MSSLNPRLGVNAYNKTGFDLYREIADRHAKKYNPSVNMRMRDERRRDPLTKSNQRLASMRAMHSREGPINNLDYESNIMEGISRHLSTMRPNTIAQSNMRLEDENAMMADYLDTLNQYGSGRRNSKRTKRKKTRNRYY